MRSTHTRIEISEGPRCWVTWALSLCVLGAFFKPAPVVAYPENYPPFPTEEATRYSTLKAEPVIDYHSDGVFEDDPIRISTTPERDKVGRVTEVRVNDQVIFDTASAHPEHYFQFGSRVFYVDLTGDGRKDILLYSYPGSVGIGSQIEIADLLIAQPNGRFNRATFEAFAAGPEDFIDVDGDGRYEMLWVSYYQTDEPHSYWVYRLVEIEDAGLKLSDRLISGFPKIVWFTEKPNDQPAEQLTKAQREALIRQSDEKWASTYMSQL